MPSKKTLQNLLTTYLSWICVSLLSLLAIFTRFWQIRNIPLSFYYDEMDYVFTGEAIARFGTDITGKWSPFSFRPLQTLNVTAELPSLFHAIFQIFFGFGPQSGHLPAAFFGLISVIEIGFFSYSLTKKPRLAIASAVMLAISPWHIHLSRMGYETVISLFFQIVFIHVCWSSIKQTPQKYWQRLVILCVLNLSLFLAYFTYHGAKVTTLVLSIAVVIWLWTQKAKHEWKIAITFCLIGAITVLFTYSLQLNQLGEFKNRSSEFIFSKDYLGSIVNSNRRQSLISPLLIFGINKPIILIEEFTKRYVSVFDFPRLFTTGLETGFQFSLIVHGFFYITTLPLLFFGLIWLWKRHKDSAVFLIVLFLVSPCTSAITVGYQSIFRSALTYLLMLIFSAAGVCSIWEYVEQKEHSVLISIIFACLIIETLIFSVRYLSSYPLISADNHFFEERLLANYVSRTQNRAVVVAQTVPYSKIRSIVAYNQLMTKLSLEERLQFSDPTATNYTVGQVQVSTTCPNLIKEKGTTFIVQDGAWNDCNFPQFIASSSARQPLDGSNTLLSISSPIDSRAYFYLVNDQLCDEKKLLSTINNHNLVVFKIEKLTNNEFCEKWIKKETK